MAYGFEGAQMQPILPEDTASANRLSSQWLASARGRARLDCQSPAHCSHTKLVRELRRSKHHHLSPQQWRAIPRAGRRDGWPWGSHFPYSI